MIGLILCVNYYYYYWWCLWCWRLNLGPWEARQVLSSLPALVCIVIFAVLGFELRAYTLSHSTSPFFVMDFFSFLR
jgi:hypothetical protein